MMVEQATGPEAQAPEVRYSSDDLASGALIPLVLHEKFGPPEASETTAEQLERRVIERFCQTEIRAEVETFGGPGTMGELSMHADYFAQGYLAALNDLGMADPDLDELVARLQGDGHNGQRRGQAGGKANVEKHGVQHMREIGRSGGRKGGRPTWQETLRKAQQREEEARKRARGRA